MNLVKRNTDQSTTRVTERVKYLHLPWEERISHEKHCWETGYQRVAGFDEAGRGPLAGPVVASSFVIPKDFFLEGLNDSKQLTALRREKFYQILTKGVYEFGVGIIEAEEIDKINIYQASRQAMLKALQGLKTAPDYLLVDALKIPSTVINQEAIIHGDALSVAIAAASVIAKCTRDAIMLQYDALYPGYGFAKHKGYPTREHYLALEKLGPSPIHRLSFRLDKKDSPQSMNLFGENGVVEF
jgi:ribonuclease HII